MFSFNPLAAPDFGHGKNFSADPPATAQEWDMQTQPEQKQSHHSQSTDPWVWKINACCLKKKREKKKKLPVIPRCIYTRGSILAAEGCSCVNLTFVNINWAQRTLCSHEGQSQVPQVTEASGANVHMRCLRIHTRTVTKSSVKAKITILTLTSISSYPSSGTQTA